MRSTQVTTLSPDSIEQFHRSLCVKGRSEHTAKSYASDLRQLLSWAPGSSIDLSDLEDLGEEWLTETQAEVEAKTTTRRLTSLRAFARWAGHGELFLDYSAPTPAKPIPHPLLEGMPGVYRMIDQAQRDKLEPLRVCVALCGLAGLRISESLLLPPANIDFPHKRIKVLGKGNKERIVPMSPRLAGVLLEPTIRALGQPTLITMKDRLARRSITRLGKRAGIAYDVASHQLRATFATHLSAIGVPLRTIQEILGHANVTQTEVYTAVNLQQMADAVKDL